MHHEFVHYNTQKTAAFCEARIQSNKTTSQEKNPLKVFPLYHLYLLSHIFNVITTKPPQANKERRCTL